MSHDQTPLYERLGSPEAEALPDALQSYAMRSEERPHCTEDDRIATSLSLRGGVEDIVKISQVALESGDASFRRAAMANTPNFVDTVAKIATLSQSELYTYYQRIDAIAVSGLVNLTQLRTVAHEMKGPDFDPAAGCPFAKERENGRRRDPLFDKFVKWATDLVMIAADASPGRE